MYHLSGACKTTYNDNETGKVKHGIKRITSRKINHGHGFKNCNAQMVHFRGKKLLSILHNDNEIAN